MIKAGRIPSTVYHSDTPHVPSHPTLSLHVACESRFGCVMTGAPDDLGHRERYIKTECRKFVSNGSVARDRVACDSLWTVLKAGNQAADARCD